MLCLSLLSRSPQYGWPVVKFFTFANIDEIQAAARKLNPALDGTERESVCVCVREREIKRERWLAKDSQT